MSSKFPCQGFSNIRIVHVPTCTINSQHDTANSQHDTALLEEPDCHDTVRLSSGCESSESGVEAALIPSHMLGVLPSVLRNSFHLAEL